MRYQMWVRHPGHPNLPFFPNRYARRMFVMAAVHWYQYILKEKKRMLAYSYDGSIPSMGGPYTLREYLYEMLNTRTPIDDTLLWAFAMETESAISIILEDGIVYSVTNPYDVKDCDFVLTLTRHNHFSAAGQCSNLFQCCLTNNFVEQPPHTVAKYMGLEFAFGGRKNFLLLGPFSYTTQI